MQYLDYDVARIFIKTGERVKPKKHPCSWYIEYHSSNTFKIGEYSIWCHYDGDTSDSTSRATVNISKPYGLIPFDIANAIYEKFKDDSCKKPIFGYNGITCSNPSLIDASKALKDAKKVIANIILQNPRLSYFFSEEAAEKTINPYVDNMLGINMCLQNFSEDTFVRNMQKFEKSENHEISYITLYTMEQLEFVLELLKSE